MSEFLAAAKVRGAMPPGEVDFLAPAARASKLAVTVARANTQSATFRILTMQDRNECHDPVLVPLSVAFPARVHTVMASYAVVVILCAVCAERSGQMSSDLVLAAASNL
ncbi:hypothetical protein GCM10010833_34020 [Blastomonas aquatica]|uniref:Uncharacterized protein n=1 Tax=Blastomonas aquatica TaxID=1510276 RepID=A0ABQ1JVU2_9SPHN|nr:hypothetical protein GCM10010833_34020 [Blastomonas aquatica]